MTSNRIAVVQTGTANLASVQAALIRLGAQPTLVQRGSELAGYDRVVLPGVGSFGAAMDGLIRGEMVEALSAHAIAGRPLLAICLGMQLLALSSEESPGVEGIGVIPAKVRRFTFSRRIPQLGWNRVTPGANSGLVVPGWAYFANSYVLTAADTSWEIAWADHGEEFVAALARGSQLACQFHPELSGAFGAALLERWWSLC